MRLLRWFILLLALFTLSGGLGLDPRPASAQVGAGYDLTWNTLEGGSTMESAGGGYTLSGAFGQAEAGPALEAGAYRLVGGFWSGAISHLLYLPLVIR